MIWSGIWRADAWTLAAAQAAAAVRVGFGVLSAAKAEDMHYMVDPMGSK